MSATIDTGKLANYFGNPIRGKLEPTPVINVDTRGYAVSEFYLEDLKPLGPVSTV